MSATLVGAGGVEDGGETVGGTPESDKAQGLAGVVLGKVAAPTQRGGRKSTPFEELFGLMVHVVVAAWARHSLEQVAWMVPARTLAARLRGSRHRT